MDKFLEVLKGWYASTKVKLALAALGAATLEYVTGLFGVFS